MSWNEFVGRISAFAELRSHSLSPSAEFVRNAAALGTRLNLADRSLVGAYAFINGRRRSGNSPMILAEAARKITFEIILLSLEAGYSIPLHDHPKRAGVSLCVSGEANVTNYDLHSAESSLTLRMRSRATIHPREAGTLTENQGNIHTITAVRSTQIIDIFSPAAPASGGFHFYKTRPESGTNGQTTLRVIAVS